TTKRPRKICALPKQPTLNFFGKRTIDFWLAALFILIWMTRGRTRRWVFLSLTPARGDHGCASPRRHGWLPSFIASTRRISHRRFCSTDPVTSTICRRCDCVDWPDRSFSFYLIIIPIGMGARRNGDAAAGSIAHWSYQTCAE